MGLEGRPIFQRTHPDGTTNYLDSQAFADLDLGEVLASAIRTWHAG